MAESKIRIQEPTNVILQMYGSTLVIRWYRYGRDISQEKEKP